MPEERHTTTLDIKVDDREIVRLGQEIERSFSTRSLDAFNKVLERQTKALQTLIDQQTKLQQKQKEGQKQQEHLGRDVGLGALAGSYFGARFGGGHAAGAPMHGGFGGRMAHTAGHMMSPSMAGAGAQGHLVPHLFGAVPIVGPALTGAIQGGYQYYNQFVQLQQARAGALGQAGTTRGGIGAGVRYGMTAEQTLGMLPQFAQQTGMAGRQLEGLAPSLIELQRLAGVGGAGAIVGAAGAAGGQVSGARAQGLLIDAVGSGLAAGIRESRLDQFIQSTAGFVEQMRTRGFPIAPESVMGLVRGLGEAGIKGMAAQRLATTAGQGIQQAFRGRGMLTALSMQATGVGQPGGRSYFDVLKQIERDPFSVVPDIIENMQKLGGGIEGDETKRREMLGAMLSFAMRGSGVEMTQTEAEQMMMSDPKAMRSQMGRMGMMAAAERSGRFVEGRRQRYDREVGGELSKVAMRRLEEAGVGGGASVSRMVDTVHHADLEAVKVILPKLSDLVTSIVHFGEVVVKQAAPLMGRGDGAAMPKALVSATFGEEFGNDWAAGFDQLKEMFGFGGKKPIDQNIQRRAKEKLPAATPQESVPDGPNQPSASTASAGAERGTFTGRHREKAVAALLSAAGHLQQMGDEGGGGGGVSESEATGATE